MEKADIWLVNAQTHLKAAAMMVNASTVAKKGELSIILLNPKLIHSVVTQRPTVPTLAFSKEPAAFARKKVILPRNVLTSPHQNATIARKKVSISSSSHAHEIACR